MDGARLCDAFISSVVGDDDNKTQDNFREKDKRKRNARSTQLDGSAQRASGRVFDPLICIPVAEDKLKPVYFSFSVNLIGTAKPPGGTRPLKDLLTSAHLAPRPRHTSLSLNVEVREIADPWPCSGSYREESPN